MSTDRADFHISRRELLTGLAGVAASTMVAKAQSPTQSGYPGLTFPTEAKQRLAVTSYPFRTLIESPTNKGRDASKPGMDLKEFPAMIVLRFGVYNINPLGDHFSSTDPAYVADLREAVAKAGSHVVDLGLGGKSFGDTDKTIRDASVEYGKKWIDIAVALGSPSVRQHLSSPAGGAPVMDLAAESLGKLAEYGAKRNIVVLLENDAPGSEDPYFIISVLQRVNSPYLRGLPDFGNSIRGHKASYNEKAVDGMFKYAYNMCHVKDKLLTKEGKTYDVNLSKMFKIAKANAYRGYFSMEVDTATADPFEGTKHLVAESLKYLA